MAWSDQDKEQNRDSELAIDSPPLEPLIRREAIDAHAHRLGGEVFVAHPISTRILSPIFALLIGALIAFASLAHYPRTETVSGYLSSSAGTSTLIVPRPGVVQ